MRWLCLIAALGCSSGATAPRQVHGYVVEGSLVATSDGVDYRVPPPQYPQ